MQQQPKPVAQAIASREFARPHSKLLLENTDQLSLGDANAMGHFAQRERFTETLLNDQHCPSHMLVAGDRKQRGVGLSRLRGERMVDEE